MSNIKIFVTLNFFIILFSLISKNLLFTENIFINSLIEQLTYDQIEEVLNFQKKWEWVGYIIIPIIILIRSSLVGFCLSIGMFLYNMDHNYKFKQFLKITLIGEFVLALVIIFKLGYFYFIKTDYTLQDLQQYYPLSYINFIDITKIEPWLIYPLQTINLFEVAYFFALAFGLWKLLKNKFSQSFEIAAVSYGSGLVIWLGLVMFFTLNMS